MKTTLSKSGRAVDLLIAFLILGCLLGFTYGILFVVPYAGFYFNPSDGEILVIYKNQGAAPGLQEGDFIEEIGPVTWNEYRQNKNVSFFQGVQPGEVTTVIVRRGTEHVSVAWVLPGFNQTEFSARFLNILWLAYVFWIFGTATQIAMRPRDLRWRLFVSANYLTALFIIFGSLSARQMWMSSPLLHAAAWLMLPVYVHFHWIFPTPLRPLPRWLWAVFYAGCLGLAATEIFLSPPRSLYFLAVLLTLLGSISLLFIHFIRRPAQRSTVRILAAGALLALLPTIVVSVLGSIGWIPQIGPLFLLVLPIMPATYFYAAYRGQLGGVELRSSQTISTYAFLILLGTILLVFLGYLGSIRMSQEAMAFTLIVIAILTAVVTHALFPMFQAFLEKNILGITLPSKNLPEIYSARITTSTSLPSLLRLLEEEVFPSLLVRQYAFVRIVNGSAQVSLSKNVTADQIQEEALMDRLASSRPDRLVPFPEEDQPLGWVRLILPLKLESNLIGAWLLGRRDPDDLYLQAELPILQSLADQTAIALSNMVQTERLRKMYADDIERNEKSRLRLALDLHDSILNQLAVLRTSIDEAYVSPKFQSAYEEVTSRLREIVTDLRPPMLSYGLQFAIEELADNLMERSRDSVNVVADVQVQGEVRYPESIEQHIFRMMQEACENAMKHGRATQINILATLEPESVWLLIEDNGSGFQANGRLDLDILLESKHFGLAGMLERAMLINAEIEIDSCPEAGARIQIRWSSNKS
jgi:signal transduction histidine kinase